MYPRQNYSHRASVFRLPHAAFMICQMGRCIHVMVHQWRSEDSFMELGLFFHLSVGSGESKLGHQDSANKHPNWLSHLTEERNCHIAVVECYGVLNHSPPIASQIRRDIVNFQSWINCWCQGYKYKTQSRMWLCFFLD